MKTYEIRDKKTDGLYAIEHSIVDVERTLKLLCLNRDDVKVITR